MEPARLSAIISFGLHAMLLSIRREDIRKIEDAPASHNLALNEKGSLIVRYTSSSIPPKTTRDIFVGREAELDRLNVALQGSVSGAGRVALLVGESGIGKTRTAEEFSSRASAEGVATLWGSCYEDDGAPPYWPWVQVIREFLRTTDNNAIRMTMRSGASAIASIVPEAAEMLDGLPCLEPLNDPESERFRIFDTIATFLRNRASFSPLLLVLDDLHWADESSLSLLRFVASGIDETRLLVIGTYQDVEFEPAHPLHRTLAELARHRLSERILLQGLERDAVKRYVTRVLGGNGISRLSGPVFAQSEGNPLFMSHIVRQLVGEQETPTERLVCQIPAEIREVVGRSVSSLSGDGIRVLRTASVIGREFGLDLLELLFEDLSGDRLLDVLEEALRARVVVETFGAAGTFQYRHTLIRQTISAELSQARKARLHARIAKAMEALYGVQAVCHAAEIAEHYEKAGNNVDTAKSIRYLQIAGEVAYSTYAWEEARRYFKRGIEIANGAPMSVEKAALHLGFARSSDMDALSGTPEVIYHLTQAFDYYVDIGDSISAVRTARERVVPVVGDRSLRRMLERALKLVDGDSIDYGWIVERIAEQMFFAEGDREGARVYYERATRIAESKNDHHLLARVYSDWANMEYFAGSSQLVLNLSHRVVELTDSGRFPFPLLLAHGRACEAEMFMVARHQDAVEHVVAQRSICDRTRLFRGVGHLKSQIWSQLIGDWATARNHGDRALAAEDHTVNVLYYRIELECLSGDLGCARRHLEQLRERWKAAEADGLITELAFTAQFAILSVATLASIEGSSLFVCEAREAAVYLLSQGARIAQQRRMLLLGAARLACTIGDPILARDCLEGLDAYEVPSFYLGDYAAAAHGAGFLDRAAEIFKEALEFYEEAGYRPYLAWNSIRFASALAERNNAGDSAMATELLRRGDLNCGRAWDGGDHAPSRRAAV